jgi:4-hydroxybenzoate polyprenyltransferase
MPLTVRVMLNFIKASDIKDMMMERILAWGHLLRPFTLIAPFIAVFFGVIIQLSAYNDLNLFVGNLGLIIFAALILASAQAVGQILNQLEDIEVDKINNKGYRPVIAGLISKGEAEAVSWILSIFAILGSFAINISYGFFISLFLLFGVLYNLEPFRVKKRLWINTGSLAISRGLLPFPAAWCILGNIFDLTPWLLGSIAAIWVLAWQNTKDLNDVEGDRKFGIITPAVYHAKTTLNNIMAILSLFTFLVLAIYLYVDLLPIEMVALFILAIPTGWMAYKMYANRIAPSSLENNELWATFYLTLAGFYIVGATVFLIRPYLNFFA